MLEGVPGLGPTRRKRLVKELGGVKAVKEATLEELQALTWLPDPVAEAVYKSIHDPTRSGRSSGAGRRVGERRALGGQRRLVAGRLHRRRRPRVRRADPADGGRRPGRGARRCSTSAPGRARSRGWPGPAGADAVVGVDPTRAQIEEAHRRGGGPAYARAGAAALPFARASFDAAVACLVFEHIADVDDAIGEVARVLAPGGRFALFLNHPLLQTPNSGWIDDQVLDPPEQYWRIGPYLVEDTTVEEVEKGVFIPFIHRPLSRYLNALSDAGLVLRRMEEPAPPRRLPRPGRRVPGGRVDPAAARPAHGEGPVTAADPLPPRWPTRRCGSATTGPRTTTGARSSRGRHVCRRCLVLYPLALVAAVLASAGVTLAGPARRVAVLAAAAAGGARVRAASSSGSSGTARPSGGHHRPAGRGLRHPLRPLPRRPRRPARLVRRRHLRRHLHRRQPLAGLPPQDLNPPFPDLARRCS